MKMLVSHSFNQKEIQQEVEDPKLLLTDGTGSYLLLGQTPQSRYEGLFHYSLEEGEMYRIVEDIRLGSSYDLREIIDHSDFVERLHGEMSEFFFMPPGQDALVYELTQDADIQVTLDVKQSYDNRTFGRVYTIAKEGDALIVTFQKKTDHREDPTEGEEEYQLYLIIYAEDLDFSLQNQWIERDYPLDRLRKSLPDKRYIFDALRLRVKKCVFTVGKDKKKAYRKAKRIYRGHISTRDERKRQTEYDDIKSFDHKIALYRAKRLLQGNIIDGSDLFAGLPWFFQYWARDTGYCLKSLIELREYDLVENLINRHLERIDYEGLIPNRIPPSQSASADAIGIIADRLGHLLETKHPFKKATLQSMKDRLHHATYLLRKFKTEGELATNKAKETWMDTDYKGDARSGKRIELQALRCRLYEVMHTLTGDHTYEVAVQDLKKAVKKAFYKSGVLWDAPNDPTQRPNIFLAAYFFPRLFKPSEWEKIIDHALTELWLSWGGLSSISQKNELFTPEHTGEDTQSYHRGDSWYFVNNIAALVMHRIDRHKYKEYIDQIITASTKDLLWGGVLGHASELSSAKEQTHQGCLSQSWSAATYIELLHAVYLIKK